MARHFILAQSEVTARALGAWLELLGEPPVNDPLTDDRVLRCRELGWGSDLVHAFREIVSELDENLLDGSTCDCATVLVDHVDWGDLNATSSPQGWSRLVSLLILTFPDVRWVFGTASGVPPADAKGGAAAPEKTKEEKAKADAFAALAQLSALPALFDEPHDPIFDGIGLRQHIVANSAETKERKVAPWLPIRNAWSCAVDDEAMYAYLHGYVAYRNGFRSFPVYNQSLADRLLDWKDTNKSVNQWGLLPPTLTMEDYYLGFPDKSTTKHLARMKERSEQWPVLDDSGTNRNFVTSGHGRSQERQYIEDNELERAKLRAAKRGGRVATKPIAGIFSLWKELRLKQKKFDGSQKRGRGPGYVWPPEKGAIGGEGTGHSAPGLLLLVAENLIHRAEQRVENVCNVRDAVKGAVLALSAQELLGPKTPTTAREALELKHRFEALAECQFGGVQYNLDLKDRFDEIRRDMKLLGHWYGVRVRGSAVLNGELAIVSCLLSIYKDNEEFDEEETCRKRIRDLQRKIWWRQRNKNPITWFVWPIRAYIDLLLGSLSRLLTAIVIWIAGLSLGFWWIRPAAERADIADSLSTVTDFAPSAGISSLHDLATFMVKADAVGIQTLGQALSSFFGAEPFASGHVGWIFLTVLAMFSGFVHLGIFISQLYTMASRR